MSDVRVRTDITTLSRKPTEWGFPMYRVSAGVRSTHGQDGAIVLDIRQGQMFNLNLVGSRILELLESGSAQAEIVEGIIREFGVSRHLAENDVQDFLQTLTKYQLVESMNPPELNKPWNR